MAKRRPSAPEPQADLFDAAAGPLFPVRRPTRTVRAIDLSLRIKTAMGEALKECSDSATVVAARMTELTGRAITVDALYAYTAASKPEHDMGITRFVAFVRATGATWLWQELLDDDGLTVLEGREAHFAQLGQLQQQATLVAREIARIKAELGDAPVHLDAAVRRRRRVGGR